MPRGGKREGAGRKEGSATARTREAADKAASEGLTPLAYMLNMLRDESETPENRRWAADKAAPYVHAKLAAIEHSGGLDVTTQTKEQRDAAVAAATRANA